MILTTFATAAISPLPSSLVGRRSLNGCRQSVPGAEDHDVVANRVLELHELVHDAHSHPLAVLVAVLLLVPLDGGPRCEAESQPGPSLDGLRGRHLRSFRRSR